MDLPKFIERWASSGASERANKDLFFTEFCDLLGVPHPEPATGDLDHDRFTFERDARLRHEEGVETIGKIDLYKQDCFLLEAKQGSDSGSKKHGTARRDTAAWHLAMQDAYGQAVKYVETVEHPPPFLLTCDIGYCFDLYAAFGAERDYHPFPNARKNRRGVVFTMKLARDQARAIREHFRSRRQSGEDTKMLTSGPAMPVFLDSHAIDLGPFKEEHLVEEVVLDEPTDDSFQKVRVQVAQSTTVFEHWAIQTRDRLNGAQSEEKGIQ